MLDNNSSKNKVLLYLSYLLLKHRLIIFYFQTGWSCLKMKAVKEIILNYIIYWLFKQFQFVWSEDVMKLTVALNNNTSEKQRVIDVCTLIRFDPFRTSSRRLHEKWQSVEIKVHADLTIIFLQWIIG